MGIFKKINFGLRKTRNNVSGAIDNVLDSYTSIDQELFDELEEALLPYKEKGESFVLNGAIKTSTVNIPFFGAVL